MLQYLKGVYKHTNSITHKARTPPVARPLSSHRSRKSHRRRVLSINQLIPSLFWVQIPSTQQGSMIQLSPCNTNTPRHNRQEPPCTYFPPPPRTCRCRYDRSMVRNQDHQQTTKTHAMHLFDEVSQTKAGLGSPYHVHVSFTAK